MAIRKRRAPVRSAAPKAPIRISPPPPRPPTRRLWVYARDPLLSNDLRFYALNEVELPVRWEPDLQEGPVGEYLEVIDIDPASRVAYEPVDLNHPRLLAQSGYKPTEGRPQFHQQMVYAVAMTTIAHFERALGRVALWAPRLAVIDGKFDSRFVRRLRIYPHALREANAYYSPDKCALLFGYFRASRDSGENLPGGLVFNCLSHDVIAHETSHALLDGLHPRYKEPTSADMAAFHEAFADIVALFQHFTIPAVLQEAIREARGHAGLSKQLADLAVQFGQATGARGALRSAIERDNERANPGDPPPRPMRLDDEAALEPHARGEILVSAIFAAFTEVYNRRTRDLFRLATGGTGVLPQGEIPHDLAMRLATEAAAVADDVLQICIRALDYCPPVDLTFGEYLRALVTADSDLIPDDRDGYRIAFISAFRDRGIYPPEVYNLSVDALTWQPPDDPDDALVGILDLRRISSEGETDRLRAFVESNEAARALHNELVRRSPASVLKTFGIVKALNKHTPAVIDGVKGTVSKVEIHGVRPARRISLDRTIKTDIIVKMTQSWTPDGWKGPAFRGGCTLVCDQADGRVRYVIRKRVGHIGRTKAEMEFRGAMGGEGQAAFFAGHREPFAMLHRSM